MSAASKRFIIIACLYLLTGVQLGALGAHALNDVLTPQKLVSWELAVQYQLIHALGIIVVSLLYSHFPGQKLLLWASWLLTVGIILFSGSIYTSALGGESWAWAGTIAPFGGSSFMLAWLLTCIGVWRAS